MPTRPKPHDAGQRKPLPINHDRFRPNAHQRGYTNPVWRETRKRIALRDRYTCQNCGAKVGKVKGDYACDHKVPKSQGGSESDSNLQTLCIPCHSIKTAKEDGGFGHRKRTPANGT